MYRRSQERNSAVKIGIWNKGLGGITNTGFAPYVS
jgi:hypothetical protein